MRKQIFCSIRKTLGLLLLVLFVASLITASVSAVPSKDTRQDQYTRGYHDGYPKGYHAGFIDGTNCKPAREFPKVLTEYNYRGGYSSGFQAGYGDGYVHGKKLCGRKLHPLGMAGK